MTRLWGTRATGKLTRLVLARDGWICWLCGQPGADTADHLVAQVDGGGNSIDNLRAAHRACNSRRGAQALQQRRTQDAPPSRNW
jgi:5-methylcytosine-specific restriction endonuclease McrA